MVQLLPVFVTFLFSGVTVIGQTVVISNDDGWAEAQIRAQFNALDAAGFEVVLSSPAENQSGRGSLSTTPEVVVGGCEFNSCPPGSPAVGLNASDPRLNYVNAFPVDAARFGIETLAPQFFGSPPDILVSGPNVGRNTGLEVFFSGTVGAAIEGTKHGVPAIAFSGQGTSHVSYTTLSDSTSTNTISSLAFASLTVKFVQTLFASGSSPLLPSDVTLNVNYPTLSASCSAANVQFVLSRALPSLLPVDIDICDNRGRLPTEDTVLGAGCFASVSVLSTTLKLDANASKQSQVLTTLSKLPLVCLP
ncbi:survival protein sure-like phosphatase/nucleotidase [Panus rudis PR-1116 ss-1]|nr:survival protein sure-like phosphatase/nucleotidase [Panus rudis PR-1116 ss-1]